MDPFPEVFLFLNSDRGMAVLSSQALQEDQLFPTSRLYLKVHLGSECFATEGEIVITLGECSCVVVWIQEDHDAICLALSKEEVGCLIKRAQ